MQVVWNEEKHCLGIPSIDAQHRQYFLISNQFSEIDSGPEGQKQAVKLLKRLLSYAHFHFSTEEALFAMTEYPGSEQHNREHLGFTQRIKQALADVRKAPNYDYRVLMDFLVNWIIDHIMGQDRAYADYFKENNIEISAHFSAAHQGTVEDDALEFWESRQLGLEISDIDAQHRELVYILQQASDLNKTGASRKQIILPEIIKKLFYYAEYHFSFEEEVMARQGYPLLAAQQDLHRFFIQKVHEISDAFKKNKDAVSDEVVLFLKDWVVNHILVDDKDYKKFLANKGH